MNLSGSHFEYCGVSSRKYNLVFARANTSEFTQAVGNITSNFIFNKKTKQKHYIGENFEDSPIQFDAEIMKWGCKDEVIHTQERRDIEKWLFHRPGYNKLYVDLADDTFAETVELVDGYQKRLYMNCRFINPEKIEDGAGLRGYKFTVECDSCMAWQDAVISEHSLAHTSANSTSIISVNVDTDIRDYTYPKVTMLIGNIGGDIAVINHSDSDERITSFVHVYPNSEIIMDGNMNYISGQNFDRFKNRNFVRLLDGENRFSVTGNVSKIKFEWNNRRYL